MPESERGSRHWTCGGSYPEGFREFGRPGLRLSSEAWLSQSVNERFARAHSGHGTARPGTQRKSRHALRIPRGAPFLVGPVFGTPSSRTSDAATTNSPPTFSPTTGSIRPSISSRWPSGSRIIPSACSVICTDRPTQHCPTCCPGAFVLPVGGEYLEALSRLGPFLLTVGGTACRPRWPALLAGQSAVAHSATV
jgi:hypothetical protein